MLSLGQKQNEDSFYTVLAKLYFEWVLHNRSELLHQPDQTILQAGSNQQAKPYNRDYAKEIEDHILFGKLIFPHVQLSASPFSLGHQ